MAVGRGKMGKSGLLLLFVFPCELTKLTTESIVCLLGRVLSIKIIGAFILPLITNAFHEM